MRRVNTWDEPFLPWVESENDRRFRRQALIWVAILMTLGIIVPFLPVPEPEIRELQDVSPRLAKLVLEKQIQEKKAPPPPKPETRKKEPEKKPEKKTEKKPEPGKKPAESARKKAEQSGLVALSDELADLRDSFDVSALDTTPQKNTGKTAAAAVATTSAVLTAKASKGSGGINTGALSQGTGGSELASRSTTSVSSKIGDTARASTKSASTSKRTAGRPESEIELVFQKNKGAIYSLYNRALRKDPTLQGKVVLELTIAPSGKVTQCRIVSSELNDPALERKLVARVRLFKFAARDVSTVTVKYPIDFLPT